MNKNNRRSTIRNVFKVPVGTKVWFKDPKGPQVFGILRYRDEIRCTIDVNGICLRRPTWMVCCKPPSGED